MNNENKNIFRPRYSAVIGDKYFVTYYNIKLKDGTWKHVHSETGEYCESYEGRFYSTSYLPHPDPTFRELEEYLDYDLRRGRLLVSVKSPNFLGKMIGVPPRIVKIYDSPIESVIPRTTEGRYKGPIEQIIEDIFYWYTLFYYQEILSLILYHA